MANAGKRLHKMAFRLEKEAEEEYIDFTEEGAISVKNITAGDTVVVLKNKFLKDIRDILKRFNITVNANVGDESNNISVFGENKDPEDFQSVSLYRNFSYIHPRSGVYVREQSQILGTVYITDVSKKDTSAENRIQLKRLNNRHNNNLQTIRDPEEKNLLDFYRIVFVPHTADMDPDIVEVMSQALFEKLNRIIQYTLLKLSNKGAPDLDKIIAEINALEKATQHKLPRNITRGTMARMRGVNKKRANTRRFFGIYDTLHSPKGRIGNVEELLKSQLTPEGMRRFKIQSKEKKGRIEGKWRTLTRQTNPTLFNQALAKIGYTRGGTRKLRRS